MRYCEWINRAIEISRRTPTPSYAQIAAELGVSKQAVNMQFLKRGIYKQKHNGGRNKKYVDEKRFCHQCGKEFTWTAEQQSHWHSGQQQGKNPRKLILCSKACVGRSSYKGLCFVCRQPLDKSRDYRHAHPKCHNQWMKEYNARRRAKLKGLTGDGGAGIFPAP